MGAKAGIGTSPGVRSYPYVDLPGFEPGTFTMPWCCSTIGATGPYEMQAINDSYSDDPCIHTTELWPFLDGLLYLHFRRYTATFYNP
jgi:hypothetical protein